MQQCRLGSLQHHIGLALDGKAGAPLSGTAQLIVLFLGLTCCTINPG